MTPDEIRDKKYELVEAVLEVAAQLAELNQAIKSLNIDVKTTHSYREDLVW